MKLAAIINAWDGCELLTDAIKCIYDHVDLVIIVYQNVSNLGEDWSPLPEIIHLQKFEKVAFMEYEPDLEISGSLNEVAKRNLGIEFASMNRCTHFISMDVDEFYEDFGHAKELYIKSGHRGSVCRLQTYFKKPTFMFDKPEDYYVPFIHELRDETVSGNTGYSFYVDPTRAINEDDVVELPIFMHHFSWVRKDIMRKARNSSASGIIKNSTIFNDYNSPDLGEGYFLSNWNRRIKVVEDKFGLSHLFF